MVARARMPATLLLAVAATYLMFRLMHLLLALTGPNLDAPEETRRIEIVPDLVRTPPEVRRRKLPNRQRPMPPPPMKTRTPLNVADPDDPSLQVAPTLKPGISMDALLVGGDLAEGPASAKVRVEPIYPAKALQDEIEGWVLLRFDIAPTGSTSNVKVIRSSPSGIFNIVAKNAVLKWKYKPLVENGEPLWTRDVYVRLVFELPE